MGLKAGYKQTEMGIIPEDWAVKRLGDLAEIQRGASPRPIDSPQWFDRESTVGWVRITDVTQSKTSTLTSTTEYLSAAGISNSRYLPKGSLIMSICATVGVPVITAIDTCIHDGFVGFSKLKVCTKEYIYVVLKSLETNFQSMGQVGSQSNLNTDLVRGQKILLPPLPEQRAIAKALADVEALIGQLERITAKKRDIKQGALQNLLTGRQRLPEFKEAWTNFNIVQDSTLKARIGWQGLKAEEYLDEGEYSLVTGTDFHDGRIVWSGCSFVDKFRYIQDRNIQIKNDDVLITKDGTIGKIAIVESMSTPSTLNSGVFVVRPKHGKYLPKYLFYVLRSSIFTDFLERLIAGSTIIHLYQKDMIGFSFEAPKNLSEQQAIVTLLSDMDDEITALEQRLGKTRALKQGMMQELLTGRTRLVGAQ